MERWREKGERKREMKSFFPSVIKIVSSFHHCFFHFFFLQILGVFHFLLERLVASRSRAQSSES